MSLFDFNGDVKVDLGEEWLAYQMMKECIKAQEAEEKRKSYDYVDIDSPIDTTLPPPIGSSSKTIPFVPPTDTTPPSTIVPPKNIPCPPVETPSTARCTCGCAVQILGVILFFATLSSLGGGAVVPLIVLILIGGLIITNGRWY